MESSAYVDHDIIVTEGDAANRILTHLKELGGDFVAMGVSKGIINRSTIGHKIKSVLKKANVPLMVVSNAE